LVNERSASASEILAGAIKDSKVGILVGEKTYGKGVIQKIYETKDGRAFKMTVEEYLTRDEHHINKLGIQPDVKVPVPGYIYGDDTKLTESDRGEQVYQMEKILEFLGYDIKNPDEFYDEETKNAVAAFQKDQGMYAYGMADFSTQNQLNEVLLKKKEENDIQLKKAYEILEKQVKEK
jgi:carboxyl-terminal processing protease